MDFSARARLRMEIVAIISITALAAFLRFYGLTELPNGFHGDEGVLGMLAQQIWRDGSIGVYSGLGGGHPTGPDYLYALPLQLLGNTMFAVRFAPTLLATLTIPALYFLLRRYANNARPEPAIALLGAFLLATMNWHIHFSRVGFPLVMWPLFVILAAAGVLEAMRRRTILWWALAGAVTGVGLYMYNAHSLFLAALGLFILAWLWTQNKVSWRSRVLRLLVWCGVIIIVALPLILYAVNPDNGYFTHFRRDAVYASGEWQAISAAGGVGTKLGFLLDRYFDFWKVAVWQPRMTDTIDATGVAPIIRPLLLLCAAAGVLWGWQKRASPLVWLAVFVVLLMPLGYVVTSGGLARRSFAAAPWVACLAAFGIIETLRWLRARQQFHFSLAAAMVLLGFITWQNLRDYFVTTATSAEMSFVYCEEFTRAVQYMKTLPPDAQVYFLSDRWSFNYEPRQFLAPEVKGEDRSRQFGNFDLSFDRTRGRPAFIFVGEYKGEVAAMRDRFPGGEIITGPPLYRDFNQPSFYAYLP